MRIASVLCALVWLGAAPSGAQNLLVNPDFDLDPIGNGWTAVGAGAVTHLTGLGQPLPSVALYADGNASENLFQCVPVQADAVYAAMARSYTSYASGNSTNAVRLGWYSDAACSNIIDSFDLPDSAYPPGEFVIRSLVGVVAPHTAASARVDLEVVANGTATEVDFDAIYLPEPEREEVCCAAAFTFLLLLRRRR